MNAYKHRCTQTSQMSAERLEPKGKQSSPGRLTSCRREFTGLPVYRANLNPPVLSAEHGKAARLGHGGSGQPDRKAGPAGAALGWPKKPKPVCNEPDMPTSAWPGKARQVVEPLLLGKAIDERRPLLSAPKTVAQRSTVTRGRNLVLPNGSRGIGCAL